MIEGRRQTRIRHCQPGRGDVATLPLWLHRADLDDNQRAAVLRRFPRPTGAEVYDRLMHVFLHRARKGGPGWTRHRSTEGRGDRRRSGAAGWPRRCLIDDATVTEILFRRSGGRS